MQPQDQVLHVWGELACFTRPELKVERFSYPVITPSAARGIYDAIYCKPEQFRWQITCLELLRPPAYLALRRNEVKDKAPSTGTILHWADGREEPKPIWADGAEDPGKGRTQRQTMALKQVEYRLHARLHPWPGHESRLPALEAQFRRRAAGGKCIYQPYLGCREFPAYFELVEPGEPLAPPAPVDLDLGWMLYDVHDLSAPQPRLDAAHAQPPRLSLFQATVQSGVLRVPDYESEHVRKAERRAG